MTAEIVQLNMSGPQAEADQERNQALAMAQRAREITVQDQAGLNLASDILKAIKGRKSALEVKRKDLKAPILEAGRRIDGLFNPVIEALEGAERIIKVEKIQPYLDEQDRIAREQQRILAEKAEKERQRLAALAAESERKAREAEAAGNAAKAAALAAKAEAQAQRAEEVQTPVLAPVVEAPKGLQQRDNWSACLVDMMELIRAAAGGDSLAASMLEFNQTEANKKAKALKNAVNVPGVKFVNRPILAQSK